jgi:hypothetical protein
MAKSHLKLVMPATVNRTVKPKRPATRPKRRPNSELRTREYLTEAEVERLMNAARGNRWGDRDATMLLMAFRHGLRASEVVDLYWDQVDFQTATLHVRRTKKGSPSAHPIIGDELRALRRLQREQEPKSPFVFASERGAPFSTAGFARMVERAGREAKLSFKAHPHMLRHACGYALANKGHDTRALQAYLGHRNIQHTVRIGDMEPVKGGLVASLNRPGGNITGVFSLNSSLGSKRLELLPEVVPKAAIIGMLVNPNYWDAEIQVRDAQAAAVALGLQLHVLRAGTEREIEAAFASAELKQASGLLVANDASGGLMSYAPSFEDMYRQARVYVGRIINGTKVADLPRHPTGQVSVGPQPQDCQVARPDHSFIAADDRRRGDRVRRREFIMQVTVAAKRKRARIVSIQRWTIVVGLATLNLWCSAASPQISNLPEDIQKRLSEINPLYQSNISKYGPETLQLLTPLLAAGPKAGVIVSADEAYGADPRQKADVYQPQGANNLPIVVFVHGGALTSGNKNETSEISANVLYYFARNRFSESMPPIGWRRNMSIQPQRRT